MSRAAVPFTLKRSSDLYRWSAGEYKWSAGEYKSTRETVHGLVRLEADRLVIQWRVAVQTESSIGSESYETREDIEPVREIVIPLATVAGAFVPERRWWDWTGPKLVITASDLLAFEKVAGQEGLKLEHPSKLALKVARADRLIAEEFAAEVVLAVAQLPEGGGVGAARLATGEDPAEEPIVFRNVRTT